MPSLIRGLKRSLYDPWFQTPAWRRACAILAATGLVLAWFADLVLWYEQGHGVLGSQANPSVWDLQVNIFAALAFAALASLDRFEGWAAGIFLTPLAAYLVFLAFSTGGHPAAVVPSLPLVAAWLVWVLAEVTSEEEATES